MILVLLGFVLPSAIGALAVVGLRSRCAANAGLLRDALAVAGAAVIVAGYFLTVALLGGVTEPRDLETFVRYVFSMTSLTLPIWGSAGLFLPTLLRGRGP